jgi:hypothetical protein
MVGGVAALEQVVVGGGALVSPTRAELHRETKVADGPGLTIGCGSLGAEERTRRIQAQLAARIGDLLLGELGAVVADTLVVEYGDATFPLDLTPQQEGRTRTAGDIGHLSGWIAKAIGPHGL